MSANIIAKCLAISNCHFLNIPYKEQQVWEMYGIEGIENKASAISHYCTIDVLKAIIDKGCLRFSDVRFLNDSTEFIEIIPLIKRVLLEERYSPDFKKLILNSNEMKNLEHYMQSYIIYSDDDRKYEQGIYRFYTCSFSTNSDSLSMWNYYASSGEGISLSFDHAWNMFEGCNKTEVNTREVLWIKQKKKTEEIKEIISEKTEKHIIIYGGIILYKTEDKMNCLRELFDKLQKIYEEAKNNLKEYEAHILSAFYQAINHMRCFFKNESFECEKEYRFMLKIPEELLNNTKTIGDIKEIGQFKRGNVLIPYVDYNFKKNSINQITLNPYIKEKDSLFQLGIEELLWHNQMQNVRIAQSSIPIRKFY